MEHEEDLNSYIEALKAREDELFRERMRDGMKCPTLGYKNSKQVWPPSWFTEEQQWAWFALLEIFTDAGTITTVDLRGLDLLAIGYARCIHHAESPQLSISKMGQVFRWIGNFGGLPSERRVKTGQSDDDQFDMFAKRMRQRNG